MFHRSLVFSLLLCLLPQKNHAAGYYNYDENCKRAYLQFMSLHLQEGNASIIAEKKTNPGNLMADYIADYNDCILLLMNCDKGDRERVKGNFDERIKMLEKGDPASPWYRFCLAGIYLHKAIVNIRFGEQYKAAINYRHSFSLLEENEQLFPTFEYNHVFTGLERAVIGSLPGSYRWLASVLGMSGSVKKGTEQLTTFIYAHNNDDPIYAETVLYYVFARFYLLSEQKETWDFLNSPAFSTQNNLLYTFAKVNIAIDYRRSDVALDLLHATTVNPDYSKYPIFDYQFGAALLTKLDTNCTMYLSRYTQQTKSDIYIKDAWQKMAFAWYATGNIGKAGNCLAHVTNNGAARLDADKQALRFAESKTWPLKEVLQARLLIDGGYNDQAIAILKKIAPTDIKQQADKTEYFFRLARAYQAMYDDGKGKDYFLLALDNYKETIAAGKNRKEQYAPRASLQIGKMYEQIGMKKEAVDKYKECLDMPPHDFQNSIDQQAKAGVNRIESSN